MTTWFVASGRPGTSSFLDIDAVAVNFHVRTTVEGLSPTEIKRVARGLDATWDSKNPATQTLFSNQLEQFASTIAEGDHVITFDPKLRSKILVGRVSGGYWYEEPSPIDGHPHLLPVEWLGWIPRPELLDGGNTIPRTRNVTVRHLPNYESFVLRPLNDPSEVRVRSGAIARRVDGKREPDEFRWEPETGDHRYLLTQTFGRPGPPARPVLVVMLNPGTNNMPGFRRSTTCHAVRRWAQANGFDGAVYINLFTHIEPNSSRIRDVPLQSLNGSEADEQIRTTSRRIDGPTIAGWGAIPSGLNRGMYDRRVTEVRNLLGKDLLCVGVTNDGYPRHGRWWRSEDKLIPLP